MAAAADRGSGIAQGRLVGLEAGRGLAALAVVLFHANVGAATMGLGGHAWFSVLEHGVDFFFVLSGYIIYRSCHGSIGEPSALSTYALKRAVRLLPMLWLLILTYAILKQFWGTPPGGAMVLRSLLPYPSLEPALPVVVWTLRHEMLFYVAFAVLIAARRIGIVLMAGWAAAVGAQMIAGLWGAAQTGVVSLALSSYTLDFFGGMLLARFHLRQGVRTSWLPLCVGIILLIAVLIAGAHFGLHRASQSDYVSPVALYWTPVLGVACLAVVHGLVCAEGRLTPPGPIGRMLLLLGAASYAIYLVHTIVNGAILSCMEAMPRLAAPFASTTGLIILLTGAGVIAGLWLHLRIEAPIGRALTRRFISRPRIVVQPTTS